MNAPSVSDVERALAYIPADDRDTWVKMGMAVKSALGDTGFDVWDQWSSGAKNYNANGARDAWKSFRSNGKITTGTLFHEAKAHGWRDNATLSKPTPPTPEEIAQREAKRKAEADALAAKHDAARERANMIWAEALPAQTHAYLIRKGIQAPGLRLHEGRLVVPLRDVDGVMHSLQFIDAEGNKKFLPGGKITGTFYSIGAEPSDTLLICEGMATAHSLNDATGKTVAAAMNCGNLAAVAKTLRHKYPGIKIILCADDDRETAGNPGSTKAREAAQAVDGFTAIPDFGNDRPEGLTDFNDLHQAQGLGTVKRSVDAAMLPDAVTDVTDVQANNYEASAEAIESAADEIIRRLAKLKPREYDKVRTAEAKALGIRPTTLDAEVKEIRAQTSEADRLPFAEVEPWPEPINPEDAEQLLSDISDTIRRFVIVDKPQADAAALWVAGCWVVDVIECAPIALINAPEKACGKTQFLTVLAKLAPRPVQASSISPSVVFRVIELHQPTLFIDEIETVLTKENEALRGLINAGHTRDSAYVWRSVGDDFEPKRFRVYGMKAIAGINADRLAETVTSRSIIFEMRRKLRHEKTKRLRDAEPGLFATLIAKLARFAADYSQQVKHARPALPDELGDRAQDNWEPLLAIAACAGNEWLDRATKAALKLSGAGEKTVSTGNELLADIQHIFNDEKFKAKKVDKISTADLIAALIADDEKSWATFNRGKPISAKQIATRLSGYGIRSKQMRFDAYSNPVRGFELSQFNDAFARYLPENGILSVTPLQPSIHGLPRVADNENATAVQTPNVAQKPASNKACNAVTGKSPILGGAEEAPSKTNHLRI